MEIEKVQVLYDGWESQLLVTMRLRSGKSRTYHVDDHGDSVAVLAYDPERKLALVIQQPRAALVYRGDPSPTPLELPGGLVDGEDPEIAARRETLEETGVRLNKLEPIGTVWMMPGVVTERSSLFLAQYSLADRIAPGGGLAAEDEDISIQEIRLTDLADAADDGRLTDIRTFAAVQTLRLKYPLLFARHL